MIRNPAQDAIVFCVAKIAWATHPAALKESLRVALVDGIQRHVREAGSADQNARLRDAIWRELVP